MADNTSATGGPLTPTSTPLSADLDLDVVFSRWVRGITGLPPGMVRPRWQEKPPQQPPKEADWCAIGVTRTRSDGGSRASIIHIPEGDGYDILRRYEILEVLASFYGPNSAAISSLMRDGLALPQNREPLFFAHIALIDVGDITPAAELLNTTWRRKQDLTFRLRRRIDRKYAVNNLLEADGSLDIETYDQTWSTEN